MTRFVQDEELTLTAIHPGVDVAEVIRQTGWDLKVAADLEATQPPTTEELTLLREALDAGRVYLR